jgi:ribonucleoside-diphosphate reductase alpha chain
VGAFFFQLELLSQSVPNNPIKEEPMKNNPFPQPICEQIWNAKYRLITPNPDIADDTNVQDTWRRIATACATDPLTGVIDGVKRDRYFNALFDFGFLPAGRITAGAGSGRNVTLFNCYVMGTIPDSMGGIFDMLKEAALTMQQGGGIGYDFSPLRPKNSPVKGVDADASGPLTFMDVWDSMCRTVMSAGSRRGAMMATMTCTHPDVQDFITAKHDSKRLRMFNVSVLATDAFMEAVKNNETWALVHVVEPADTSLGQDADGNWIYEYVQAADLWQLMMESTFGYAEPGVLFIDRINKMNNLWYVETIAATNPCGEQPLPPYGACLLGSINLTRVVRNPFEHPEIDAQYLEMLTQCAVEMLDSIIDISLFPVPQQKAEALAKRRMGIGITGLADMLFMMNLKYGSMESVAVAERTMKLITLAAYRHSIELAKTLGPCPVTKTKKQRQDFINSGFMMNMPEDIRQGVLDHGIRNALLISIAPTGTISLYAGNVSSGVEPIFAASYTRKVLEKDGSKRSEVIYDAGVGMYNDWRESKGFDKDPEPKHLVTAQTLKPYDHLVMQAAVQKWVDSSISKTINCPEDISFEDFEQVYLSAYQMGCKGCTTYRPNDVTGSVLSVEPVEKPVVVDSASEAVQTVEPVYTISRKKTLSGQTYKLKWENSNFYVTINNHIDDETQDVIPFEIFINTQDMSHFQWTLALTRMMSSVFRRGGDIRFVIEDLKSIMDPNGGAWVDGKYLPSFIALLGSTLEQHLNDLGSLNKLFDDSREVLDFTPNLGGGKPMQCVSCKGYNVNLSGGCPVCADCGHSKCG